METESKETFEYLNQVAVDAAKANVIKTEDGQIFITGRVRHWYEDKRAHEPIYTHTISSIAEYIRSGADGRKELFINVDTPSEVELQGLLNEHGQRETLMMARLAQDDINFGQFMDRESLNITLQSMFDATPDKQAVLEFISHLQEDKDSTAVTDDGISQTTTIKTGSATLGKAKVPNPVKLRPYRTFNEVEQPASDFVFRMREGMQGAIFEADGGMWKNEAIRNIKEYLNAEIGNSDGIKVSILG